MLLRLPAQPPTVTCPRQRWRCSRSPTPSSSTQVALLAAVFIAAPVILFHLWRFIRPGLYSRERYYTLGFIVSGTLLFACGGAFAYYVAFPFSVKFLLGIGHKFTLNITGTSYLSFLMTVILGLALMFELPLVIVFLARVGLVTPRFLLRNFRYAVLVIFGAAAIITPTSDVFNLCLFAVPTLLLYLLGIAAAAVVGRARSRAAAAAAQKKRRSGPPVGWALPTIPPTRTQCLHAAVSPASAARCVAGLPSAPAAGGRRAARPSCGAPCREVGELARSRRGREVGARAPGGSPPTEVAPARVRTARRGRRQLGERAGRPRRPPSTRPAVAPVGWVGAEAARRAASDRVDRLTIPRSAGRGSRAGRLPRSATPRGRPADLRGRGWWCPRPSCGS